MAAEAEAIVVHQFGAPDVQQLVKLKVDEPGAGQVLVRVLAVGVNPVDTYIRSGASATARATPPYTPGADGAGTIEKVGAGVTQFKVGDRVYIASAISGTYRQFALANQTTVFPLHESLTYEQGAAINIPYATAYRALFLYGDAKPGQTVFIQGGSGGVGLAAIQLSKAAGLTIIATAGSEAGLKLVKDTGADHVLDHGSAGYLEHVKTITNNKGVDIVIENAAHFNLGNDLPLLARRGKVLVVGSRGPIQINARDIMFSEANIQGIALYAQTAEEAVATHSAIASLIKQGAIKPVIGQRLPLAEAAKSHDLIINSKAFGKIVLLPFPQ